VSSPTAATVSAKRAIIGLTGTVARGSALSNASSLAGSNRENCVCHTASLRLPAPTACSALPAEPCPDTNTAQLEPKHSNMSLTSAGAVIWAMPAVSLAGISEP
jgi:hypothetical protein